VYYIQYAHARIASVRRKAGEELVARALHARGLDVELHPSERALVQKLLAFPDEVAEAAERRAPHRISAYALELAQVFTAFYRDCQVVGVEPEALEDWRLRLSVVTQRTIARALDLLGVQAPDEM
jgi:arginyl-tRNA synthetase